MVLVILLIHIQRSLGLKMSDNLSKHISLNRGKEWERDA